LACRAFVLLQKAGEAVEPFRPEALIARQPFDGARHGFSSQAAIDRAPALGALNQVGARQDVEMFDDGGERNGKGCRNFGDSKLVGVGQPVDDGASRRVGERAEGKAEGFAVIVNHMV
jgi:hypothetical protein